MTKEKRKTLHIKKKWIFYIAILILPLIQFCIFYIGVNFNSIMLAFKVWDPKTANLVFSNDMSEFKRALTDLFTVSYFQTAFKNSIINYLASLLVIPLALFFSYYIYKKGVGSGIFKVILYMPQILSVSILVIMYKYFVNLAIPTIGELFTGELSEGLLANPKTEFNTILFFSIWASFGTQMLMYTGSMSGISDSIVDAAKIDGVNPFQEFLLITVPLIYSTITTFVVVGVAHFFTGQMHLYSFKADAADYNLWTFGYFLYRSVQTSSTMRDYPYLASFSIIFTVFAVPLTLGVKALMEKLGPKAD